MFEDSEFARRFGEALRAERERQDGLTQAELGRKINTSGANISKWERGISVPNLRQLYSLARELGVSYEWLLERKPNEEHIVGMDGFRWRLIRPYVSGLTPTEEIQNVQNGIDLFTLIINTKGSILNLQNTQFAPSSQTQLKRLLQTIFWGGVIQIVEVKDDRKMADELRKKYAPFLRQCHVAAVDLPTHSLIDTTIRLEIVAKLAAQKIPTYLAADERVGVTGGATLARFADLISPAMPKLSGLSWLPLLTSQDITKGSSLAANSIVARMLYNQPGSQGYRLPFIDYDRRSDSYFANTLGYERNLLEQSRQVLNQAKKVSVAIISVGSIDSTFGSESQVPGLNQVFDNLPIDERERCQGNILLRLIDTECKQIGMPKDREANEALVYSIELQDLHNIAEKDSVWAIVAREQKAEVLNSAIKSGIVNNLVIDRAIAKRLKSI